MSSTWAVFAAMGLLMLGNGLQGSLVGVRAEMEGFPTATIGVVTSGYYLGFLFGSRLAPYVITRVGHVRAFAALAALTSATVLVLPVFVLPELWVAIRVLAGFCLAGLYVVAESWLNSSATNTTRGRILSVYMVVATGGYGLGQFLLGAGDPAGFQLFVLASVLVSLSLVPLSLPRLVAPAFEVAPRLRLRELWAIAPLGIFAAVAVGLTNGTLLGMGPVYGAFVGLAPAQIGFFMAMSLLGGMVLQWPLGSLSDRVARDWVIFAVTMAASVVTAIAALTFPGSRPQLLLVFLFGGLTFPLYSLALSHVNDLIPHDRIVAASSAFVFLMGVGAVAGPFITSMLITMFGPAAFWWTLATMHASLGAFGMYRYLVAGSMSSPRQRRYRLIAWPSALITPQLGTDTEEESAE